jgi:hypothetical protein
MPKPRRTKRKVPRLVMEAGDLDSARAAFRQARAGGAMLVLVSPPDAAAYLGAAYFWALVEAARAEAPGVVVETVMDCGDGPGWALGALRTGFKTIVLKGNASARARVSAIAKQLGARVLSQRPRVVRPVAKGRAPV